MSLLNDISRHQESRPIKPANRVKRITRKADGSMVCERDGDTFTLPADAAKVQEFIVFTMIYGDEF